ncbi:MAG: hypothetical protein LBI42_15470 [Chitinispirillales bacterium]|jgi:hypothetical protein|nr:hypothetical protein [Chitinispirillales bacterium]
MNGIQGSSSASSWEQFVKIKQAARERNSGFSLEGASSAARSEKAAPKKVSANVYSVQGMTGKQDGIDVASHSKIEENVRIKGNNFDAYA